MHFMEYTAYDFIKAQQRYFIQSASKIYNAQDNLIQTYCFVFIRQKFYLLINTHCQDYIEP